MPDLWTNMARDLPIYNPNTILLLISVNDVSAYEFRRHRHLDRRWPARPCADRVMTYALALARAVVAMRVEDYFQIG
ncbi:MAG TPA: hypothetical protein VNZ53_41985 [Steroidobacteraceae bacterium]|jgi:hypothetical protein|nr:hypothetical protein [Steroidobacteraceae bacterium]